MSRVLRFPTPVPATWPGTPPAPASDAGAQASATRIDEVLQALPVGVIVFERDGRVRHANAAAARMLDYTVPRLAQLEAADLARGMVDADGLVIAPGGCPLRRALESGVSQPERLVGLLTARNEQRWLKLSVTVPGPADDDASMVVCGLLDVSESLDLQRELSRLAHSDGLTGLANRAGFITELERLRADAERTGWPLALLVLDLNGFKHVNDTLGHLAGDALLVAVAQRLTPVLRADDRLARMGGDEFVLLVPGGEAVASKVAERLHAALAAPFTVAGQELFVSVSVGAAVYPGHARDVDRLFQLADTAMQAAKRRKCGYLVHQPEQEGSGVNRLALDAQLHRAIEQRQFVLHYQPRYEAATGRLVAVEALVRWNHPERGLVLPGEFIGLAEETGMIVEIGRWVLGEACRQAVAWQRPGMAPLRVSINVSAVQFDERFFAVDVPAALAASSLPAALLELEITETALMTEASEAALPALERLRAQGLRVLLDDFGTGYSSLSYLHRFPLDGVKIDRSFVAPLPAASEARAIVGAVLGIAGALGLEVVAEGVETPAQRDYLVTVGCQQLQGWLLAKPVTASMLGVLLSIGRG